MCVNSSKHYIVYLKKIQKFIGDFNLLLGMFKCNISTIIDKIFKVPKNLYFVKTL